jgi:hypothetical protein
VKDEVGEYREPLIDFLITQGKAVEPRGDEDTMQKRILGTSGLEVSAIELGCMQMSAGHGEVPEPKRK